MSSAPLSASQLDRIEDALEQLEHHGVPTSGRPNPEEDAPVLEHLAAYRQILVLSRQAMPVVEPPPGLLDSVFAEARQAMAVAPVVVAATDSDATARPSWWHRVRAGLWVPALGFAAAAALVLVLRPMGSEPAAEGSTLAQREPASASARAEPVPAAEESLAEERFAQAEPAATDPADADGSLRGAGGGFRPTDDQDAQTRLRSSADPGALPDPEPVEPEEESEVVPARDPKPAPPAKTKVAAASKKTSGKEEPAKPAKDVSGAARPKEKPSDDAVPKTPVSPTNEAQGRLSQGETRRRAGNCAQARSDFTVAAQSADKDVRARALAGIGLCELAAGNDASAESWFAKARAADIKVKAFIETERQRLAPAQAERD